MNAPLMMELKEEIDPLKMPVIKLIICCYANCHTITAEGSVTIG